MQKTLLTAREAAEQLGVKLDTLYAYVSRGLLRSVLLPGSRERRYRATEVAHLTVDRGSRRLPKGEASDALSPVIASRICLIETGRLYYRGEDALRLAERASLEEVALLLWQASDFGDAESPGPAPAQPAVSGLIERCQLSLLRLAESDLSALDLGRAGVVRTGARILRTLAATVAGTRLDTLPIHEALARAWGLDAKGADIVRRALVLIADHELNASSFVARCVASTGATPYAVVLAALAALSGRRHGGATVRTEALLRGLGDGGGAPLAQMAERVAAGESLPGFGHPLYPEGDPRARAILAALGAASEKVRLIEEAAIAGTKLTGSPPTADFALAGVAVALGLPQGAALGFFIIGRTVGWIAHAIEQYESGTLIRPRARYLGPRPQSEFD